MQRRKLGLLKTFYTASRLRHVQSARAKSKRNTVLVNLATRWIGGYVVLVRYWVKTDTVTIHRYTDEYYAEHFTHNGFWRPKSRSRSGYSRKWDDL